MKRIYIAGHRGLVGSALCRRFKREPGVELVLRTHSELDLTDQKAVQEFFATEQPDQVYLAAAKVGGIYANNTYPADFIRENLAIELNVIDSAYRAGVDRLLFLGSSCIYPPDAPQPLSEDALLTGLLEPTNEPYALAKISGIKMCESYNRQYGSQYRSVMPTNLYGPEDNFDLENSHVIPALIRKFHEAKEQGIPAVEVWGSGKPLREFLYVDDMADACVYVMNLGSDVYERHTQSMLSHVNVGTGIEVTIKELASIIGKVVAYKGDITFDSSKPDGAPRKLLDVSRLESLGWDASTNLEQGLRKTYDWFLEYNKDARK